MTIAIIKYCFRKMYFFFNMLTYMEVYVERVFLAENIGHVYPIILY